MYEIWLTLNIAYEQLLPYAIPIGITLFIVFYRFARILAYANPNWRSAIRNSLIVGVVFAIISLFMLPGAIKSSFSAFGYWFDWVFLIQQALSLGFFVAIAALAFFIKDQK